MYIIFRILSLETTLNIIIHCNEWSENKYFNILNLRWGERRDARPRLVDSSSSDCILSPIRLFWRAFDTTTTTIHRQPSAAFLLIVPDGVYHCCCQPATRCSYVRSGALIVCEAVREAQILKLFIYFLEDRFHAKIDRISHFHMSSGDLFFAEKQYVFVYFPLGYRD